MVVKMKEHKCGCLSDKIANELRGLSKEELLQLARNIAITRRDKDVSGINDKRLAQYQYMASQFFKGYIMYEMQRSLKKIEAITEKYSKKYGCFVTFDYALRIYNENEDDPLDTSQFFRIDI